MLISSLPRITCRCSGRFFVGRILAQGAKTGLSGAPRSLRPRLRRGCFAPLLSLARRLRFAPAPRRGLLPPLGGLRLLRFAHCLRPVTPGAVIRRAIRHGSDAGKCLPLKLPFAQASRCSTCASIDKRLRRLHKVCHRGLQPQRSRRHINIHLMRCL
jgi:hypothetical protein